MDDLYENIKKRREELGMSQDELARKVGYTSVARKKTPRKFPEVSLRE